MDRPAGQWQLADAERVSRAPPYCRARRRRLPLESAVTWQVTQRSHIRTRARVPPPNTWTTALALRSAGQARGGLRSSSFRWRCAFLPVA